MGVFSLLACSTFFVEVFLVVNLIFYLLPACSTSFHEAFIFGLSLCNSYLIFYCKYIFPCLQYIFSSIVCSKLFLLRFLFGKLFACRWSWWLQSWISSTPTWYQSLPAASCLKDFRSRDLETNPSLFVHFSSIWG